MPHALDLLDRLARVEAILTFLSVILFQQTYLELEGKALSGCAWIVSETVAELAALRGELCLPEPINKGKKERLK